jgi:hypothetical protein
MSQFNKAQAYVPVNSDNQGSLDDDNDVCVAATVGVPHYTSTQAKNLIEMVAPADLAGGYEFSVDVQGRTLMVQVVSTTKKCCARVLFIILVLLHLLLLCDIISN